MRPIALLAPAVLAAVTGCATAMPPPVTLFLPPAPPPIEEEVVREPPATPSGNPLPLAIGDFVAPEVTAQSPGTRLAAPAAPVDAEVLLPRLAGSGVAGALLLSRS